jgi:hypothetical protein
MVGNLSTSTVDYMTHFVCYHKFKVLNKVISRTKDYLSSKLIANEKPVLDFYCSYHVVWHSHHLLLHHLLLLHLGHLVWVRRAWLTVRRLILLLVHLMEGKISK